MKWSIFSDDVDILCRCQSSLSISILLECASTNPRPALRQTKNNLDRHIRIIQLLNQKPIHLMSASSPRGRRARGITRLVCACSVRHVGMFGDCRAPCVVHSWCENHGVPPHRVHIGVHHVGMFGDRWAPCGVHSLHKNNDIPPRLVLTG